MRLVPLLVAAIGIACASPTTPTVPDGAIRVNGTVQYFNLEGGFWAIRGENGVTYDPIDGLSPSFQRENLPVTLGARVRNDAGGALERAVLEDLPDAGEQVLGLVRLGDVVVGAAFETAHDVARIVEAGQQDHDGRGGAEARWCGR